MAIIPGPSVPSVPSVTFFTRQTLLSTFTELVPLAQQFCYMKPNVRLKLEYALEGEDVRYDLAFPGVIGSITGVEETSVDDDKCVIEIAFQDSVSMGVDDLEGIRVGDRHVVRSEAYEGPCKAKQKYGSVYLVQVRFYRRIGFTVLLVHFVNNFRSITSSSHPAQPDVCKLGKPRSRNGPYSVLVEDIRNQMDR